MLRPLLAVPGTGAPSIALTEEGPVAEGSRALLLFLEHTALSPAEEHPPVFLPETRYLPVQGKGVSLGANLAWRRPPARISPVADAS